MSSPQTTSHATSDVSARAASKVTRKLLADHEQVMMLIEQLKIPLREICRRQSAEDLKKVQDTIQQLIAVMNTHAACEEKAVFPALAKYHPLPILEAEHDEILMRQATLMSGLMNYSFPEDCTDTLYKQATAFFDMYERHMRKEESCIFPLVEASLNAEEKHGVLLKMEEIQSKAGISQTEGAPRTMPGFKRYHVPMGEPLNQAVESRTLLEHQDIRIKVISLCAGEPLADHWSPEQVAWLLVEGKASGVFGGQTFSLSAGDGILMEPRLSHSLTAETNCRLVAIFM